MITQEIIKKKIKYEPSTGIMIWIKLNKPAGGLDTAGYMKISFNNKRYLTHRLAWLYVYGNWPKGEIDHINGIRSDNRIENLREVNHRENNQNKNCHREGHLVGTSYCKRDNKWVAQIYINTLIRLGLFNNQHEANNKYLEAVDFLKENGEQATIEKYKKIKTNKKYILNVKKHLRFNKIINKWVLHIWVGKKSINLGVYETKHNAHDSYLKFLENNGDKINMGGDNL